MQIITDIPNAEYTVKMVDGIVKFTRDVDEVVCTVGPKVMGRYPIDQFRDGVLDEQSLRGFLIGGGAG